MAVDAALKKRNPTPIVPKFLVDETRDIVEDLSEGNLYIRPVFDSKAGREFQEGIDNFTEAQMLATRAAERTERAARKNRAKQKREIDRRREMYGKR